MAICRGENEDRNDILKESFFLCGFFFCFVLAVAWLVVESFRYANNLVEQLCNVLMQLLWRAMPRNDENLRGPNLRLRSM